MDAGSCEGRRGHMRVDDGRLAPRPATQADRFDGPRSGEVVVMRHSKATVSTRR
jgi:hypothetical protein